MYVDLDDPLELAAACQEIPRANEEALLICMAEKSEPLLDALLAELSKAEITVVGGLFRGLIDGSETHDRGIVVRPVRLLAPTAVVDLKGEALDWIAPLPDLPKSDQKPTCLIFSDVACLSVVQLLDALFDQSFNEVNYFGAAAAMGTREPRPVVFTEKGRFTGCAVVSYIDAPAHVGVRHGWNRVSEPMIATRTSGNVIKELNWEPAAQVYRERVGDRVADSLERHDDVPEAKRYPLGIGRENLEDVVRDVLQSEDNGDLVVLSEVPQNSSMYVVNSQTKDMVSAAADLGDELGQSVDAQSCLVFDCFSRVALLGDDIHTELRAFCDTLQAHSPGCRIEGALVSGEIASDGERLPDYHNKTLAAAAFDDRH